jgi:hypothetical protein
MITERRIENQRRTIVNQNKNTNEFNLLTKETNAQTSHFTNCPLFGGRHKWSLLAFRLPHGKVSYCQFCYLEKLVPFAYNSFTEYYEAGTNYQR